MLQTVSKWFETNWEQLLWLCAIIFTQGCQVNIPCWLYKIPNTHRYKSFWRKSDFTVLCDDLSMCVRLADKCLNTVWTDWHFWCEMIFLIYLGLRLLEPQNLFFLGILFIHCSTVFIQWTNTVQYSVYYTVYTVYTHTLYFSALYHSILPNSCLVRNNAITDGGVALPKFLLTIVLKLSNFKNSRNSRNS